MSPSTHQEPELFLNDQTTSISGDEDDDYQNIMISSNSKHSKLRVGDVRPPPPGAWGVKDAGEIGSFPENEVSLILSSLTGRH